MTSMTPDPAPVPFGTSDIPPELKSRRVTDLFQDVAPNYDLMNDLMSLGLHRRWKTRFVNMIPLRAHTLALDVAGGTGDIALALARKHARVAVCDPATNMLARGRLRARNIALSHPPLWVAGAAEQLPFPDHAFHLTTNVFGLRNVTNPRQAMTEAFRVLKPLGRIAIMEFDLPSPPLRPLHARYLATILPTLGTLVARNRSAYRYLGESILRFARETHVPTLLSETGFSRITTTRLSHGVVAITHGRKI